MYKVGLSVWALHGHSSQLDTYIWVVCDKAYKSSLIIKRTCGQMELDYVQ